MSEKLHLFVSSVQKELEDERVIVQNLLNTDPFLSAHCVPVLYEFEPASSGRALEGCLKSLDSCQAYLLIIAIEYGSLVGGVSVTHAEYRFAKEKGLPVLAFIKGERSVQRKPGAERFLNELEADGLKYKRFGNVIDLQKEVRAALIRLLEECFGISPSTDENEIARQTIEATSTFESQPLNRVRWEDLDHEIARQLVSTADARNPADCSATDLLAGALLRGLAWHDSRVGNHYATAAGIVLLSRDPSAVFPQCRILADAYRGAERDGDPRDHEDIRGPMPLMIDRAIAFVDRNTRHPIRVVGLNRVRVDEYPVEALREALVNAVAHRQYEDAGRKIVLEVFFDKVVVSSPGLPPAPLTIAKLRTGKYRPCSRNPVLAHCLSYFHRIEERGSGFRRMRDHMQNHGLDPILLGTDTGYFQVTFPGPGDDLDRLRVSVSTPLITPAVEAQLSERQRKIVEHVIEHGEVTTGWVMRALGVARDTGHRDLVSLVRLSVLVPRGFGRGAAYVLKQGNPGAEIIR